MQIDWKALVAISPSYRYSTVEKLRYLAAGFRQRCGPAAHLLAGPFAGEFGYELMQWQGFVRRRRHAYQSVHVLTYPGREYLYEGCTVHSHDILLQKAGYGFGLLSPPDADRMAHAKALELGLRDYDVFHPALVCTKHHRRWLWQQEFRLFEEPPLEGRIRDLAFHFRAVKKDGPDNTKNYSPALADELAERLLARGLSVICIGHPEYSYCAKGCEDRRTVDLRAGVVALNSVRAVAGENSGPMHLANLCG